MFFFSSITNKNPIKIISRYLASSGFSSEQVELMQIDCEVTNTQLLSVKENDIPSHMKPYLNSTSRHKGIY